MVWVASRSLGFRLPSLDPDLGTAVPTSLIGANAVAALLSLLAVIGFSGRYRKHRQDLDRWLALGSTLLLAASLHYIFTPLVGERRRLAGRLRERPRLRACCSSASGARFAARSSGAPLPRNGRASPATSTTGSRSTCSRSRRTPRCSRPAPTRRRRCPKLKEAALAAQQEARFAILALSSASGRSPFDAALRRYVDVLTADGELEVELEIDPLVRLGPDEQIEVFRIVQEGLANARRHAGARHGLGDDRRPRRAPGGRGARRRQRLRLDGSEADGEGSGQGLRNMRDRAAAIGGALSLRSSPGSGTSVEVVLRA